MTSLVLLVVLAGCFSLGLTADPVKKYCVPHCAADEVCNLGVCQKISNCECAQDPNKATACPGYSGAADPTTCAKAGCCYYQRGSRKRCFQKVVNTPRKTCSYIVPVANRVEGGWKHISTSDCFCVGSCFDDSVKGAFFCFQLKDELEKIDLGKPCKATDKCKDPNAACTGGICACSAKYFNANGLCVLEVDLDKPCVTGDVCADPKASCTGGKCTCIAGFFNKGGVCAATIPLNQACTANDVCADPNAECKDGKCQCKAGFFDKGGVCTAAIDLGKPCAAGDTCKDANAACTAGLQDTCQCKTGFFAKGGVCVVVIPLDKACVVNDVCADPLAKCTGGKCQCPADHIAKDGVCTGKIPLDKVCGPKDECADPNASCTAGTCQCNQDYHNKGGVCTKKIELNNVCDSKDICKDDNAACVGGTCKCKPNFYNKAGVCAAKIPLDKPCGTTDVCADPNAICKVGTCQCKPGFFDKGGVCTADIPLGQTCDPKDHCADPLAVCTAGKCACTPDHIVKNGVCSGKIPLNKACDLKDVCADDNAICVGGKCTCNPGYFEKAGVCTAQVPLTKACDSKDICADDNSACTGGTCQCKAGFFAKNGVCVAEIPLDKPCTVPDVCADPHASCTGNKCTCNAGYYSKGGKCVLELDIGDVCGVNDVCGDPHASCVNGKCTCDAGYFNKNGVCSLKIPLDKTCVANDVCADPLATCTAGKCKCPSDHIVKNGVCSGKIPLDQTCGAGDVCADDKASCTGGKCKCNVGYFNKGGVCALKIPIDKPCGTGDVCADPNASSQGGICKCIADYFSKNGVCVKKIDLGKACTATDVCKTNFASCKDGTCQCNPGTFTKNGTCVTNIPLDKPCASGDKCADPLAACTSGKCTCTGTHTNVNGVCAGKIPTGKPCSGSDICADQFASCQGGVCKCINDYTLDRGVCVPIAEVCFNRELDIVLVFDNSRSINSGEMAQIKEFGHGLVNGFTISNGNTRFGLAKYGSRGSCGYNIAGGNSKAGVNNYINSIQYCPHPYCSLGPGTNTPAGLTCSNQYFRATPSAPGRARVAILITDGFTNVGNINSAVAAIPSDVTMYAVGVDGFKIPELDKIAGDHSRVYTVKQFSELTSVIKKLQETICPDPSAPAVDGKIPTGQACKRGDVCADKFASCTGGKCQCNSGYTLDKGVCVAIAQVCFNRKLDIVLVFDNSRSIDGSEMSKIKAFGQGLVDGFTIGNDHTRIGLAKYGSRGSCGHGIATGNTKGAVDGYISSINHCPTPYRASQCPLGSSTATPAGLTCSNNYFRSIPTTQDRSKVGILITDGYTNVGNINSAVAAIPNDVTMYAVGVDGYRESELKKIAGEDDRVYTVKQFSELTSVIQKLQVKICPDGTVPAGPTSLACEDYPHSFVFLVDTSRSVSRVKMQKIRKLIKDIVANFNIANDKTRVALVVFGKYANEVTALADKNDDLAMQAAINAIPRCTSYYCRIGTMTNTPAAIDAMVKIFAGDKSGAKKFGFFITDGGTVTSTLSAAVAKIPSDVTMFALGAGYSKQSVLTKVAGDASRAYKKHYFAQLKKKTSEIVKTICSTPAKPSSSGPATTSCRDKQFDVIFVVDNSRSINFVEMSQMKKFIRDFVDSFTISNANTRIGIVKYGYYARQAISVAGGNNQGTVDAIVNAIAYCPTLYCSLGPATNTPGGLSVMSQKFNALGSNGARHKIGILLTDGASNVGYLPGAVKGIPKDVKMFTVGIDQAVQSELVSIAGDASRVYKVTQFSELAAVLEKMRGQVCA